MKRKKLEKIRCEVCGITEKSVLHFHHIIERKIIGTSNDPMNLAILCSNCHSKHHLTNKLEILGVLPSTGEQGRTLVYILDGKSNIEGITEPFYKPKLEKMKI